LLLWQIFIIRGGFWMVKRTFYIADVFAEEKYAGNQLAVIRNAGTLTDAEMQLIAREMNYSETTFILSDDIQGGGYDVRIFTPKEEVPFAGHPTLGTAYVIQREILKEPAQEIILNLKVGQIPVTFDFSSKDNDTLWMKQNQPVFGQTLEAATVARVLNIEESDIDSRFPIQDVSTGLPFFIVPVKTLAAVKKARINRDKYLELIENTHAKAIFIFCPETYFRENDLNARAFVDCYGIPEDPATGSANGCLAGYLVKYRYFGTDRIDIRVEQGYEVDRPSLLFLRAQDKADTIDVSVGGKVVLVARGELL
jgi:trans-2,3-dihydro-3-hydroxyanthranilate isomerase